MSTRALLKRAIEHAGSGNKLAALLGVAQAQLSAWTSEKNRRPIPPYRAAKMAQLLGEDQTEATLLALADQSEGDERAYWMRRIAEQKRRG